MSNLFDKITNIGKYYGEKVEHKVTDREEFKTVREALVKYGMNTSFFDKNLRDLYFKTSKDDSSIVEGTYNARTNSIGYTSGGYDLIHELFHMASNNMETNNDLMGVLQKDNKSRNTGIGFNEGITDYFTHLSCPDYETAYPFEERIISILSETYGIKVFNEHFNANPNGFYSSFGQDLLFIMEISKGLDDYNRSLFELTDIISRNDLNSMIKNGNMLVNKMFDSVIIVCNKLFNILELKGIDPSKYIVEMKQLFESKNHNITQIRSLVESSNYRNIDNVFAFIEHESEPKL